MRHYGKSLISVFQKFFASIENFLFWEEDWARGYYCMIFLVRGLIYTMFISNNHASFQLWWKETLKNQNVSKYYDRDRRYVWTYLFYNKILSLVFSLMSVYIQNIKVRNQSNQKTFKIKKTSNLLRCKNARNTAA